MVSFLGHCPETETPFCFKICLHRRCRCRSRKGAQSRVRVLLQKRQRQKMVVVEGGRFRECGISGLVESGGLSDSYSGRL